MSAHPDPRRPSPIFLVEAADGAAHPAPSWFVDWVRLGTFAALGRLFSHPRKRTILAVSVPVRSMAAAALAFGYCRGRFLDAPALRCPPALARSPADLQPGARVWLGLPDRALSGTYYRMLPDERIHTSAGTYQAAFIKEARLLPPWAALPDDRYLLSEVGAEERAFLSSMLRSQDPLEYITSWSWDLVVAGSPARLLADLAERISSPVPGAAFGSLASIVRPLEAARTGERARIAGWRSVLMASRSDEAAWSGWPEPPAVAVLDGAYAISRWLSECEAQLIIAIIDRSEPGLDAAVSVLEQERAYMKPISPDGLAWAHPDGCELLAFGSRA